MPEVTQEAVLLTGLRPATSIVALVRARNAHGLSPPSPFSKPLTTASNADEDASDIGSIREKLERRLVDLRQVVAIGARKVKLLWEVSYSLSISIFCLSLIGGSTSLLLRN